MWASRMGRHRRRGADTSLSTQWERQAPQVTHLSQGAPAQQNRIVGRRVAFRYCAAGFVTYESGCDLAVKFLSCWGVVSTARHIFRGARSVRPARRAAERLGVQDEGRSAAAGNAQLLW